MVSKERFLGILSSSGQMSAADLTDLDAAWDEAFNGAVALQRSMPGIGFMSVQKRLAAFFAVCRQLDQIVDSGQLTQDEGQLSLQILRLSNRAFNKAMTMFEIRGDRFGVVAQIEMPMSARVYLASFSRK
jgi:hypothetical protein